MDELGGFPIDALRRLARGLLYDRQRAEDVVQEAWLAALKKRPGAARLRAWLSNAVHHLALDARRQDARRIARERRAARPEAQLDSSEVLARVELLRKLLDGVERLDEPYRTAIGLRYFDDLPPRTIARRLGVPVNTVRTRVRRGLEMLRRQMDVECGRDRQGFLAALAPLAGPRPLNIVLGRRGTSEGGSTDPRPLAGHPLVLAGSIVIATVTVWVLSFAVGLERERRAPVAVIGVESPVASPIQGVSLLPAPPPSSERVPTAPASTAMDGGWIVRGHVSMSSGQSFGRARLLGRVHRGAGLAGELLHQERFEADEHGDFAWALGPPSQQVTVYVRPDTPDHLSYPSWDYFMPGDPPPDRWLVTSHPLDRTLRGVIRDGLGRAVEGARIVHRSDGDRLRTSDAGGSFAMAWPSLVSGTLHVHADGFAVARVQIPLSTRAEEFLEVVLESEQRVHGRVLDPSGSPIAGAEVSAGYSFTGPARTDEAGRYEVGGISRVATDVTLGVRARGFRPSGHHFSKDGEWSERSLDVTLERGVPLAGRVLAPSGEPIAGVWVSFDSHYAEPRTETWTDAEGRFALRVDPGEHPLWLWRTGFAHLRMDLAIPDDARGLQDLVIRLRPGHFVAGIVLGENDRPLPWIRIGVEDARGAANRIEGFRTASGADGRFRVDGLPDQRVRITVQAARHVALEQEITTLDDDGLVLRLVPEATLAGTVVDAATGAALTSFEVRVVDGSDAFPSSWTRGVAFTSPMGTWSLADGLEAGVRAHVEVRAAGYAPGIGTLEALRPSDPARCVVRMEPAR